MGISASIFNNILRRPDQHTQQGKVGERMPEMDAIQHKTVAVNGVNMHFAEIGRGPVVLFLHGFPQLWYTWRHQMLFMASRGYRAVAPDLRGYGDTSGPSTGDPTIFGTLHVVGDLVALIDAVSPDEGKVFVVGHDWGAITAWALCLYRPDKVKALVALSVAFTPRNPKMKPLQALRFLHGDDYYICRFQEAGDIEAEFGEVGAKGVIRYFLTIRNTSGTLLLPRGKLLRDSIDNPKPLPSWLSEDDIDYYASKYDKSGFSGSLNYYRSLDTNWEETAAWTGAKVSVPVKFIIGELDLTYNAPGGKEYIHNGGFKKDVPLLEDIVVLEGVGHFSAEEKPDEVNQHIYDFFHKF